ncbi:GyrI-like domain-containing protein [Anaerotruncus rubiinfantis]|jgi:effector-binding domain-containing protein|uniref:GyrI-like domain-containing protein n=1 Tax=Anaerotruncus rubiinfantis TaxID=1720200 RepID=UPI001897A12A|nr:GyrI-like domain-containing protein [Anaerotruncus rubiinfantis]
MPKMSNVELFELREQPTLTIRATVPAQGLPELIAKSYARIGEYLAELGVGICDVPFVIYYNMDVDALDVEIGFPVPSAQPGKGEIASSKIPAGKAASCIYRGPYAQIGPAYEDLEAWFAKQRCEPAGPFYEYYYNGPDSPEDELLTRVFMPLK